MMMYFDYRLNLVQAADRGWWGSWHHAK